MMFSDKKSVHGITCAQVFVTTEGFVKAYPMKNKGEAYDALNNFCETVRLPLTIITDNAKEEYGGNWDMVGQKYLLQQRTMEPHSPWQNKA